MKDFDIEALKRDLEQSVEGEIRFEDGDRALYSTDASNYRAIPIAVVIPRNVDAISETVRVCARHDAPITNRGGGTALAGQTCNTAVIIDSSKYCNRVLEVDPERRIAVVEPGCVLDHLQAQARPHGLRFGPDPSTHSRCTIGGMIGNNSCGVHSLAYGRTVQNVEALEVITADGTVMEIGRDEDQNYEELCQAGGRKAEIYRAMQDIAERHADLIRTRFPEIPRRVSGYNLNQLLPENGFSVARALVGTEGTCATILRATVSLQPEPSHRSLIVAGFQDICMAADLVPQIIEFKPLGCEGFDQRLADFMKKKDLLVENLELMPEGCGWFLIPFGGDTQKEATEKAGRLVEWLKDQPGFVACERYDDPDDRDKVWKAREAGLGATAFVPGQRDTWPGWEDSAVAPDKLGDYLRALLNLYDKYGYYASVYGHMGEGLIHTRVDFGLHNRDQVGHFRAFMEEAADVVVAHGGSLSGEHGDGQARGELLDRMFGPDVIPLFETFKHAWDPDDRMNPGKVVHPKPIDADLRMGPEIEKPDDAELDLAFTYPGSDRSFVRETLRCVGVGQCRQSTGGTMCPSYRGTREEKHSTRGRAHLLQEMLIGDPLTDRWNSDAVHEALDLCLSCKSCRNECPVNVDMATYKAEFMHHYYRDNRRPRAAWSMGQIHRWARIAGRVPWLFNAFSQTPGLSAAGKWAAGIHQDRKLPRFAKPFSRNWQPDRSAAGNAPRVILFADTFNGYLTPEPLKAAAEVLQQAGCRLELPRREVCCGRPLYEFGFLDEARSRLEHALDILFEPLSEGAFLVGIEATCMATFKEELLNFFPDDSRARQVARRTYLLGDFIAENLRDWKVPGIEGPVRVHGHCNHKAIFGMDGEEEILRKTGAQVEMTDLGCCGMAGSFGFERDKKDVAMRIAEQQFLPAVRESQDKDIPFVANGYSCREQARQATGLTPTTLPEILRDALRADRNKRA